MEKLELSKSDESVLDLIFNPYGQTLSNVPDSPVKEEDVLVDYTVEQCKQSRELELRAVAYLDGIISQNKDRNIRESPINESEFSFAFDLLSRAQRITPRNPSIYNNRAQILRLKGDLQAAKKELDMAIELSTEKTPISSRQAYTQRALLKELEGDFSGALADFETAAKLGSHFSRHQAAIRNPYARLCNQMLSCAMKNSLGQDDNENRKEQITS